MASSYSSSNHNNNSNCSSSNQPPSSGNTSSSLQKRHVNMKQKDGIRKEEKWKWSKIKLSLRIFLVVGAACNALFYIAIVQTAHNHERAQNENDDDPSSLLLGLPNLKKKKNQKKKNQNAKKVWNKKNNNDDSYKLQAYIEPIHHKTYWNTKPLPIRNTTSFLLQKVQYPQLNSCSRLLEQFPVDDSPSEDDPFLPWIHDVFPTYDGKHIQFVAQNKRRCRTGKEERHIMERMEPQGALFQNVAVKRLDRDDNVEDEEGTTTRYRLASHEEADEDGAATRFICRFKPSMDETLSVHNVNYDYHAYRKTHKSLFGTKGTDLNSVYTSQLLFRCPVPEHLQQVVRDGTSVLNDYATLFVDLIPIRTPLRFGPPDMFFPPVYKEEQREQGFFDPNVEWGNEHILPKVEDSGRWENIPICKPSLIEHEPTAVEKIQKNNLKLNEAGYGPKTHRLIACVWASADYHTRGGRYNIRDGQRRLKEWLTYNFLTGFDHIYVYDNSGAHTSEVNLKPVTDLFPGRVTRVPWNAKVCNDRPNNWDSPGERSSQYAAEASCRLRFGGHAEWIGGFDIDEYLVPMGKYNSVTQILDMMEEEGLKMLNFASYRAWPRRLFIEEPKPLSREICGRHSCFDLAIRSNYTILQAYNCDRQPPGVKAKRMPAEKQLYYSDYVKLHFVHYSEITVLTQLNKTGMAAHGLDWPYRIGVDPYSRFSDEITEGTMLHTKAVAHKDTANWDVACMHDQGFCRLGNPYPPGVYGTDVKEDEEGWTYNCFVNEKVENYWVPRLVEANPFLG